MTRYINTDEALQIIDSYAKTVTQEGKVVVDAVRDIVAIITPTADVVPKSEYDRLLLELKATEERSESRKEADISEILELRLKVEEVFEEIEKSIANLEYRANTPRKTVKVEELKAQCDWILHEVIPKTLAELKKKYIGDKQRKEDEGK